MNEIRYSLLTDGSSDPALIPILSWLLYEFCPNVAVQPEWADLRRLPDPPRRLEGRIVKCLELYPCDLMFIHRDAEKESLEKRVSEIKEALQKVANPPAVCVVPVRMQEAWLLIEETAIRKAAGNPHGTMSLDLPSLNKVEILQNPKQILHDLIRQASGYTGRRLKKLSIGRLAYDVSKFIENFAPLRTLTAFQFLENDLRRVILDAKWNLKR